MDYNLYYSTVDSPTTATMRISGDIGYFVDYMTFVRDLDTLVSIGITDIAVRIHSGGGSVYDGYGILTALISSKANITTYNDGVAASTAGWLLLAGEKRKMVDYGLFMLHNPSICSSDEKELELLAKNRESIVKILSGRSGMDAKKISKMMDDETWLNADECLSMGFINEIVYTTTTVKNKIGSLDPKKQKTSEIMNIMNSALDSESQEIENKEVTEVTNEVVETIDNDNNIVEVVKTPEAEVESPEVTALKLKADELQASKDALETEFAETQKKLAEMEIVLNSYKENEVLKAKQENDKKIADVINAAVKAGKIRTEVVNSWTELAHKDFDAVSKTLADMDSLVFKKAENVLNTVQSTKTEGMNFKELQKSDPKKLENIFKTDRELFNQMYFESYGVMPS